MEVVMTYIDYYAIGRNRKYMTSFMDEETVCHLGYFEIN